MIQTELAVVGAGPAGLCCALEAAKAGVDVVVIDENDRPGGQLFKQIHKFFGSRDHSAGIRGFQIGERLLDETHRLGIKVMLNSTVLGARHQDGLEIAVCDKSRDLLGEIRSSKLVLATGASENPLAFPGWTLPGVIGAGAAQTMINLHRVVPGRHVLMVGSGNVGLIVGYQLLQAGVGTLVLVEAAPRVGGYEVHAAKLKRYGVPVLLSTSISRAWGNGRVEGATLVSLDDNGEAIEGSERQVAVDLICIATGLSPSIEMAHMLGCQLKFSPPLGGLVPVHDRQLRTSLSDVYVAGDASGVEEASIAMEEGRLAGISVALALGRLETDRAEKMLSDVEASLDQLRSGASGMERLKAKRSLQEGEVAL